MITRSKLVEQLRDYQIRSQHKCSALAFFSPKPSLSTWSDVIVAVLWGLVFGVLLVLSYVALHSSHFWLSFVFICLSVFLPVRLKLSRWTLAKKRDRRLILPLSM